MIVSVEKTQEIVRQFGKNENSNQTALEIIRDMMEKLVMRDGFKIGGSNSLNL